LKISFFKSGFSKQIFNPLVTGFIQARENRRWGEISIMGQRDSPFPTRLLSEGNPRKLIEEIRENSRKIPEISWRHFCWGTQAGNTSQNS
jgi:hypothetical protein